MDQEVQATNAGKVFVRVPPWKVFIMNFLTFGLYILWWVYRNWKVYAVRNNREIWAVVRSIFFAFICYPLFKDIFNSKSAGIWLTVLLWVFALSPSFVMPHIIYASPIILSIFYASIQAKINSQSDESHNIRKYYGFTGLTFLGILLGLLMWASILVNHDKMDHVHSTTALSPDSTPASVAN